MISLYYSFFTQGKGDATAVTGEDNSCRRTSSTGTTGQFRYYF